MIPKIFKLPLIWLHIIWLWCFTFCVDSSNTSIGNLTLTIEPPWVRRGQSAHLYCNYELSGAPLYSVKWYRGTLEFYRYSPLEHPPEKIFPYTGIKVDVSVSNATQVTLRNVGFNLSGNFSCEVTTDAPSFYTKVATNILSVVELPHSPPEIYTEKDKYDPGDILRAYCSTPPSKPVATITFLLNDNPIEGNPTVTNAISEGLQWSSKNLTIQVLPSHYSGDKIILRCTVEVGSKYAESSEVLIGTTVSKDPIPERVTSPNSTSRSILTGNGFILIISISLIFTQRNGNR